jgi:hypothetical protein
VVAASLTAAAAALIAVAFASGWLSGHPAGHAHIAAAAAPSPIQLLARLLVAVAVIAALARACGLLARRAGQPAVLGEIVAGLILGPTVVRRLAPGVFHALFPATVLPNLNLLAQAGLVIFMFAVGLEVDRDMLRQRSGRGARHDPRAGTAGRLPYAGADRRALRGAAARGPAAAEGADRPLR